MTLEIGPKGKKVAAVAPDWPNLERGAKIEEAALERLRSYLPRYAQVAKLAGLDAGFAEITTVAIVERYPGTGSTVFWGISFAFSSIDRPAFIAEALTDYLNPLDIQQVLGALIVLKSRGKSSGIIVR